MDKHDAPPRSNAQRMEALERANRIRTRRARYKKDLKAGRERLLDGLVDPPEWLESAKILDVLLAVPKVGRVKANKILRGCAVSPSKTIGGLSPRQRTELAVAVGGRRPEVPDAPAPAPASSAPPARDLGNLDAMARLRGALDEA